MLFIKLFLLYLKTNLLNVILTLKKKSLEENLNKNILKESFFIIKKDFKEKNLKKELIMIKLLPLTFHYEPLLFNQTENSKLEDFKNKFEKKFVVLNSKYIKLNDLLLNFYNISFSKKKKKKKINLYYVQLTKQEKNKIFDYYNSDVLFIKNSFIFYEDIITLNKKKYLESYSSYKKYGFSTYSNNLLSSNETKITNINSYSFRLEDGGTAPAWTSFIFNDSMRFLFFFYIPYIFYSYLQFTFMYLLIILVLCSDLTFIVQNYLINSTSEYSFLNLIIYQILFDNSIILFFQNLFSIYFDFLIEFFMYHPISIYNQIFLVILFFAVLFFWIYENIISTVLLDFFSFRLKNKDVASGEISSYVDDFLNEDATEEIRDVHMPVTFADNNMPHRQGDILYDIPRGTDYQKFITPFLMVYLFFIASWNYLFFFFFFYISFIFWSDFDFFCYILKFFLFNISNFINLNLFFSYNLDFEFFSYLPLFYYIIPFIIILFIITFSLKFSGFIHLYEDLYTKYKLKTEKGFYIYYNLLKNINLKTLFVNFFSTKAVYYIDRNVASNKNTNIFYFCLNMFFLFLNPLKNILLLVVFLLLLASVVNFAIMFLINILNGLLFYFQISFFYYSLINIKLVFLLKFLIGYFNFILFFIKILFYLIIVFSFFIFIFKIRDFLYLFVLNIFHFILKFSVKQKYILFLCLILIILRLFFFKFIFFYFLFILFFSFLYFIIKLFSLFLYDSIIYILKYICFSFIKVIVLFWKYKSPLSCLFLLFVFLIILNSFFSFIIIFFTNFSFLKAFLYPYLLLSLSNFFFFLFFFLFFLFFLFYHFFIVFNVSRIYFF